jgi:hypothetical protein
MADHDKHLRKQVFWLFMILMVGVFAGGFFLGKSKRTTPAAPLTHQIDSLKQVIAEKQLVVVAAKKTLDSAQAAVDALLFQIIDKDVALQNLRKQYAKQNIISADARELERLFAERYGQDF